MSVTPVSAASAAAVSLSRALEKSASGEITAASVVANPGLAAHLIKLKDGNYAYPIVAPSRIADLEPVLSTLKLGG